LRCERDARSAVAATIAVAARVAGAAAVWLTAEAAVRDAGATLAGTEPRAVGQVNLDTVATTQADTSHLLPWSADLVAFPGAAGSGFAIAAGRSAGVARSAPAGAACRLAVAAAYGSRPTAVI
jgi:hypothetical protein